MSKIIWDMTGERYYETGTYKGVLYIQGNDGSYQAGVPWNGLTAVTESPEGAEPNDMYADNIKYATLRSAETFAATIEAYTYPDEFAECDGSVAISPGIYIGQQSRRNFGFSYVTNVGNDTGTPDDDGYKIHLIYNATASPSEKSYQTINDSPEGITFSWEIKTSPVNVTGYKATSTIVIDSLKVPKGKLSGFEDILYGTESTEPRLPLPDEVKTYFETKTADSDTYRNERRY